MRADPHPGAILQKSLSSTSHLAPSPAVGRRAKGVGDTDSLPPSYGVGVERRGRAVPAGSVPAPGAVRLGKHGAATGRAAEATQDTKAPCGASLGLPSPKKSSCWVSTGCRGRHGVTRWGTVARHKVAPCHAPTTTGHPKGLSTPPANPPTPKTPSGAHRGGTPSPNPPSPPPPRPRPPLGARFGRLCPAPRRAGRAAQIRQPRGGGG